MENDEVVDSFDKNDFDRVRNRLLGPERKMVYEDYARAIEVASTTLEHPYVQQFLYDCLPNCASILVMQYGPSHKDHVKRCVDLTIKILPEMIKINPVKIIDVFCILVDPMAIIYKAPQVTHYDNPNTSMAFLRLSAIHTFDRLAGFSVVWDFLNSPTFPGLNTKNLRILLQALLELKPIHELLDKYRNRIRMIIQALHEDAMKKESSDQLSLLFETLTRAGDPHSLKLDYILKCLRSSSIVLKLSGWEIVQELVDSAIENRPFGKSYEIRNAGSARVNGIYELKDFPKSNSDVPKYSKVSSDPSDATLTMFRASIKHSKEKWWFISLPDLLKPYTEDDIDYYSLSAPFGRESRDPPESGWQIANKGQGQAPFPVVVRLEDYFRPGESPDSYLTHNVMRWALEHDILGDVFSRSSLHREVISRSCKLVTLLAELGAVNAATIKLIWNAGYSTQEDDITDEIFVLLSCVFHRLRQDMQMVFLGFVLDALQHADTSAVHQVATFLEKLSSTGNIDSIVFSLSKDPLSRLIEIIWMVFKEDYFGSLKNSSKIENLLSICFKSYIGCHLIIDYIRVCAHNLSKVQGSCQQMIRCLTFMLPIVTINEEIIKTLISENFPSTLENELVRYFTISRPLFEEGNLDVNEYTSEIRSRLRLLRSLYGSSPSVMMDYKLLHNLWSLTRLPCERDELFHFFGEIVRRDALLPAAIEHDTVPVLFQEIFCDPNLSWSECGENSFLAFQVYWKLLTSKSFRSSDSIDATGLPTVWRIALTAQNPSVAAASLQLLLEVKERFYPSRHGESDPLIARIFAEINNRKEHISNSAYVTESDAEHFTRCMSILREAIVRSKGSSEVCHGASGPERLIRLNIRWRKTTPHRSAYPYNNNNNYNYSNYGPSSTCSYDTVLDGTCTIDATPYTTIHHLKILICKDMGVANPSRLIIEIDRNQDILESEVLKHFNVSFTTVIFAAYTTSVNDMVAATLDDDDDQRIGSVISTNWKYFDTLLSVVDILSNRFDSTSALIFDILMLIPSQADLIANTIAFSRSGDSIFKSLFSSSVGMATYLLQIVTSLLIKGNAAYEVSATEFKEGFVANEGFSIVFSFFLGCENNDSTLATLGLIASLEIIHFLVFAPTANLECSNRIMEIITGNSWQTVDKLLELANLAAKSGESVAVHQSLAMITLLLKTPQASQSLTDNPKVKTLLSDVLLSSSESVRKIASEFAFEYGKSHPAVFGWLVDEFSSLDLQSEIGEDLVNAIESLIIELGRLGFELDEEDLRKLTSVISSKLSSDLLISHPSDKMLVSCFSLDKLLLEVNPDIVASTDLGKNLLDFVFTQFLFKIPTDRDDKVFVCDSEETRSAAFDLVLAYIKSSPSALPRVTSEINNVSTVFLQRMKSSWNHQIFTEVRKSNIDYCGLKNQGCTCYMNSLLQQLFMNVDFREAVLRTPINDSHRTLLWHKTNEELVGAKYQFLWKDGTYHKGLIKSYDPGLGHWIVYDDLVNSLAEPTYVNVRECKLYDTQRETGKVKPYDDLKDCTEADLAATAVLEQLQRTFCFLKYSKRRFFDPRPFVEACKSLNLNFNVFQQNDAVEFCDKLLDRMETSMRGKFTGRNNWSDVVTVFGGKMLYQKIPKQCSAYETKKEECGHWQGSRSENFLKIELIIRGKETIEDSLGELVKAELMDGENKISCDVCNEKKATTRATCFDDLPNSFIIHLKRFDLDFDTFETFKLNNRLEFPILLNMYKFTKESREADEEKREKVVGDGSDGESISRKGSGEVHLEYEDKPIPTQQKSAESVDSSVFDYELQGVLVHAGIAQGGHYYSYVRDSNCTEKWYRFDDDDVTYFDPENIAEECFGGSSTHGLSPNANGGLKTVEHDRTSNALMLFYKKKHVKAVSTSDTTVGSLPIDDKDLVDGYQAFQNEVLDWNIQHEVKKHLLDPGLHKFALSILKLANDSSFLQICGSQCVWTEDAPCRHILEFAVSFFLNIVLHCRDRSNVSGWLAELRLVFVTHHDIASWFLESVINPTDNDWFSEFLFFSTDALARNSFVSLLFSVITICIPPETEDLRAQRSLAQAAVDKIMNATNVDVLKFARTSHELFVLIRELAAIPCVRKYMVDCDTIYNLVLIVVPKHEDVTKYASSNVKMAKNDLTLFIPGAVEAIAALMGVPQIARVQILDEVHHGYKNDRPLTEPAADAFSTIFSELTKGENFMDLKTFLGFTEKIHLTTAYSDTVFTNDFEKFDKDKNGKLSCQEFLAYMADGALYNCSIAWKALSLFKFRNDLTRITEEGELVHASPQVQVTIPPKSRVALAEFQFYETGIRSVEAATIAILCKICSNDHDMSLRLLTACLGRIKSLVLAKMYPNNQYEVFIALANRIVMLDDRDLFEAKVAALITGVNGLGTLTLENRNSPAYNQSYDSHSLTVYIDIAKQFYGGNWMIAEWMDREAAHDEIVRFLRQQVNPLNRIIPPPAAVEGIRRVRVYVSGAQGENRVLNGEYYFQKKALHGSLFQKQQVVDGIHQKFTIYRWLMKTHHYCWFISSTPINEEHGFHDVDKYQAQSSYETYNKAFTDDIFPPPGMWTQIGSTETCNLVVQWVLTDEESPMTLNENDISITTSFRSDLDVRSSSSTVGDYQADYMDPLTVPIPDDLEMDDGHDYNSNTSQGSRSQLSDTDEEGEEQIQPVIIEQEEIG